MRSISSAIAAGQECARVTVRLGADAYGCIFFHIRMSATLMLDAPLPFRL
jgi:hypothetical protein